MTTFSFGKALSQRQQDRVNEHLFAVEEVDLRISDFTMHQQRQTDTLHLGQRGVGLPDVGQAGIGVGRRPRRVKLHRLDETGSGGPGHLAGWHVVGQVKRHQRLETGAGRQRSDNAVAVGGGLVDRGHRRLQVGHDDGAGELGGGMGEYGSQCFAVAQVKVPVVGAGDGDLHGIFPWDDARFYQRA